MLPWVNLCEKSEVQDSLSTSTVLIEWPALGQGFGRAQEVGRQLWTEDSSVRIC